MENPAEEMLRGVLERVLQGRARAAGAGVLSSGGESSDGEEGGVRLDTAVIPAAGARPVSPPVRPVRQPFVSPGVDHPDFEGLNFGSRKHLVRRPQEPRSNGVTIPRSIQLYFQRLRGGQRRIPASTVRYGEVAVATPELWLPAVQSSKSNSMAPEWRRVVQQQQQDDGHETSRGRFQPSRLALARQGLYPQSGTRNPGHAYKGDLHSATYQLQFRDLADERNCALWLKRIPHSCTASDLFDRINVGAVSILHFYNPDEQHSHKAAKLVFMNPGSAAAFREQCRSGEIDINGFEIHAWYNRDGYIQHPAPSHSRVLHVNGPIEMMNFPYWDRYFQQWCVLEWDGYKTVWEDNNRRTMEFRFSRIEGQSQTCLQAIMADETFNEATLWVYYGADPCDPEAVMSETSRQ